LLEKLVAEFAAQGYDGIKAHRIESTDVYQALLVSADGHVPEDLIFCPDNPICVCEDRAHCWDYFRSLGVEAVAHIEELIKIVEWSDESIRKTAQDVADDGMGISTTIALVQAIPSMILNLEDKLARTPEGKYVNPRIFDSAWAPGENEYEEFDKEDVEFLVEYITTCEKMLVALNEEGALLMSGTDSNEPLMAPGFSLLGELEAMVGLGISPYDALRTSTYNPAKYLNGLDEFGTIEVGKRADLVLLEANPMEDISNIRRIDGVMVRGRWYSGADLDKMLEEIAKANQAARISQMMAKIALAVVVLVLLVVLVWFVVRRVWRRGAVQVSS
jgi:hypothetical protein